MANNFTEISDENANNEKIGSISTVDHKNGIDANLKGDEVDDNANHSHSNNCGKCDNQLANTENGKNNTEKIATPIKIVSKNKMRETIHKDKLSNSERNVSLFLPLSQSSPSTPSQSSHAHQSPSTPTFTVKQHKIVILPKLSPVSPLKSSPSDSPVSATSRHALLFASPEVITGLDGNVLRKVASLTLENNRAENRDNNSENKIVRNKLTHLNVNDNDHISTSAEANVSTGEECDQLFQQTIEECEQINELRTLSQDSIPESQCEQTCDHRSLNTILEQLSKLTETSLTPKISISNSSESSDLLEEKSTHTSISISRDEQIAEPSETSSPPPPPPPPPPPSPLPTEIPIPPPIPPSFLLSEKTPLSPSSSAKYIPLPPPLPSIDGHSSVPPPPPLPDLQPPPLPAPPIGGWNAAYVMARKKPVNPIAPMRPLYWTRIQVLNNNNQTPSVSHETTDNINVKKECLWEKIEEEDETSQLVNVKEFAELFSRQVNEKKSLSKAKLVEKKSKVETASIIDSKRAHNVGILITSLHLEIADIENAVYNFDTSNVSTDQLQQIFEVSATKDELELIRRHVSSRPDIPLAKAEQFLYDLSLIPEFADRVACMMYEIEFVDTLSSIENRLNNFKLICQSLTTSTAIKDLFAIILAFGNYMNGGNRDRGQADGFGLEILPKLKDVKGKNNSVTLLAYIVQTYIRKHSPDITGVDEIRFPLPEPSDIEKASVVVFSDIIGELTKLSIDIKKCESKVSNVLNGCSVNEDQIETFRSRMEAFVRKANEQIKEQEENLNECRLTFPKTMKFFSYRTKSSKESDWPKEFFANWIPFCSDFKDIFKREIQRIIKEKVDQTKQRLKELQEKKQREQQAIQKKTPGGLKDRLLNKK